MKLPEVNELESLEKRYPNLPPAALDLAKVINWLFRVNVSVSLSFALCSWVQGCYSALPSAPHAVSSCWGWQLAEGYRIPELQSRAMGALSPAGPRGSLHIPQGSFTQAFQSLCLTPGVFTSSPLPLFHRSACRLTQTRDRPAPNSCRVISSTRMALLKGKSSFPAYCRRRLERSEAVVLEDCTLGLQSWQLPNVSVCFGLTFLETGEKLEGNRLQWHIYLVTLINPWHTILGSPVLHCIHSLHLHQTGMQTPLLLYCEKHVLKILFGLMYTLHLASH